MDFKSKGMKWIVNIRQTLETVCIEVEDKLCKEVKFVESQVQTVGVNVNKFITDVMQDLLPSSTITPAQESVCDSSMVKDADAINEALVEKEPSKESCRLLNSSEESVCQEVVSSLHPYPGDTVRGGCLITPLGQCTALEASEPTIDEDCAVNNEHTPSLLEEVMDEPALSSSPQDTTHIDSRASCNPDEGVISDPSMKEETTGEVIPPLDTSHLSALEDMTSPSLSSELNEMDHEKLCASSSQSGDNISNWPDSVFDCLSPFSSYDLDPPSVPDGEMVPGLPSSGSILRSESTDDNSIESCMEDIELSDNTKLEDSCIVVDIRPPLFDPIQAGPHRSFKKMLRRALASRMGSTKQWEYEQLAILYGDIDVDMNTSFRAKENKLSDEDLSEPDWEFV